MAEKRGNSKSYSFYSDLGWILIGSQRRKIINNFNSEKIPSQIHKETGIKFSNVSRALKSMVERGLVESLNLGSCNYKLYKLTERGVQVKNKIYVDS